MPLSLSHLEASTHARVGGQQGVGTVTKRPDLQLLPLPAPTWTGLSRQPAVHKPYQVTSDLKTSRGSFNSRLARPRGLPARKEPHIHGCRVVRPVAGSEAFPAGPPSPLRAHTLTVAGLRQPQPAQTLPVTARGGAPKTADGRLPP